MDINKPDEDIVIWDTVEDLPKLLIMNGDERMAWYLSLGTVERNQLAEAAGIVVGLAISRPFMELAEKLKQQETVSMKADQFIVFTKLFQQFEQYQKQKKKRRKKR